MTYRQVITVTFFCEIKYLSHHNLHNLKTTCENKHKNILFPVLCPFAQYLKQKRKESRHMRMDFILCDVNAWEQAR